jgi:hypothetical protein
MHIVFFHNSINQVTLNWTREIPPFVRDDRASFKKEVSFGVLKKSKSINREARKNYRRVRKVL